MIRPADPVDAISLARVHVASWRAAYRGMIEQSFLDSLDVEERTRWWEMVLARPANTVHVGEIEGSVEGFSLSGASRTEGWAEVYAIYVNPESWGLGLGGGLLSASETALAAAGHGRALLWVLAGNERARGFYEHQGWELGRPLRIENIGGADVTEVRYEKSLAPR